MTQVIAADGLYKRDVFRACPRSADSPNHYRSTDERTGLPDPFAVATINGEQTKTTTVSKRTLNPYWNENFDLYEAPPILALRTRLPSS